MTSSLDRGRQVITSQHTGLPGGFSPADWRRCVTPLLTNYIKALGGGGHTLIIWLHCNIIAVSHRAQSIISLCKLFYGHAGQRDAVVSFQPIQQMA